VFGWVARISWDDGVCCCWFPVYLELKTAVCSDDGKIEEVYGVILFLL
jgi:hypothetical protein